MRETLGALRCPSGSGARVTVQQDPSSGATRETAESLISICSQRDSVFGVAHSVNGDENNAQGVSGTELAPANPSAIARMIAFLTCSRL